VNTSRGVSDSPPLGARDFERQRWRAGEDSNLEPGS